MFTLSTRCLNAQGFNAQMYFNVEDQLVFLGALQGECELVQRQVLQLLLHLKY